MNSQSAKLVHRRGSARWRIDRMFGVRHGGDLVQAFGFWVEGFWVGSETAEE